MHFIRWQKALEWTRFVCELAIQELNLWIWYILMLFSMYLVRNEGGNIWGERWRCKNGVGLHLNFYVTLNLGTFQICFKMGLIFVFKMSSPLTKYIWISLACFCVLNLNGFCIINWQIWRISEYQTMR